MEKIILLWGALILLGVNLGCRQEMVVSRTINFKLILKLLMIM